MSFSALTTNEIATGEPTKNSTFTKVKDNFDNHETRIQAVEAGTATAYPPIVFRVNGKYGSYGANNGVLKTTCNFNLTVTGVRLLIDEAGSAGTTEVDLKVSHSGGAYNSMLTTKPSVGYASGNDVISTNTVLNNTYTTVSTGDILRLDITSVQTGGDGFLVRIDYNKV